ncbi:MAG: methyltransferase domain-containing protein [Patescibacteria group bacterium]|nr:methyltransferase domain-containing protein [Patescibacteria group bacterium]
MQYLFIGGNHPDLTKAELFGYFKRKIKINNLAKGLFLVDLDDFDPKIAIKELGGVIKIAKIEFRIKKNQIEGLAQLMSEKIAKADKKIMFGFSNYGVKIKIGDLAMELKNIFKAGGLSARWVISREPILSSVVVGENKLIDNGAEFILIPIQTDIIVAKTEAIQDYRGLSKRDYGRPGRDDYSGMLPPKLAQIMLNLSETDQTKAVLDPFCGSGTVLTEAALLGVKSLFGSDISAKAIADTKDNFSWLKNNYDLKPFLFLKRLDVKELSKVIKPTSIDCVVFEGFLGPQRGKIDWFREFKELNNLYSSALKEIFKVLKSGGILVAALPLVENNGKKLMIELDLKNWQKVNLGLDEIENRFVTFKNGLIYSRPNQRVKREIIVLKK